ncbi:MAG: hypothetical protein ATN31_00985 [Candidatus Epulonipiscioides saccharophilum]|nr:MAG: hypothetical protein ATN31_00985 [Epulopiscium sp. AS2M-Bin001]
MLANFILSLNTVMPLFILIAIGYILQRMHKLDEKFVKQSNYIVFKLSLPVTLFNTIYNINTQELFNPWLISYAVISMIVVATSLFIFVPKFIHEPKTAASFAQSSFRGNFVLLGSVLAIQLFGPEGSLPTISLIPIVIPVIMILSIIVLRVLSQNPELEPINIKQIIFEIISNPIILGIFIAIIFKTINIKIPLMLSISMDYLGSLSTPLALIALGVQLQFTHIAKFKLVAICSMIKLIAIPLIVLIPAYYLGFRNYEMGALFILFSAPAGISNYALAYNMKCDYEFTGQMVIISTMLSLFTMIIAIMIFKNLEIF